MIHLRFKPLKRYTSKPNHHAAGSKYKENLLIPNKGSINRKKENIVITMRIIYSKNSIVSLNDSSIEDSLKSCKKSFINIFK